MGFMNKTQDDTVQQPHTRKRRSIRTRFQAVIVMLVILSTIAIAMTAIKSMVDSYITINENLKEALEQRYRINTRNQVESLISLLKYYSGNIQDRDHIPLATQQAIKSIIRHTKYDQGIGYFFLYDLKGNVLAHGNDPMLEGKNLLSLQDANGVPVIVRLRDSAKSGGGYVKYLWNKPNHPVGRYPKLAYSKMIDNTSWWIGTGTYLDDVDKVVASEHKKQANNLNKLLRQFGLLSVSLIILSFFVAISLAEIISKPIINLSRVAKKIASGDYQARSTLKNNDELGDMAESFNMMADSISKTIKDITREKRYSNSLFESVAEGLVVTDMDNKIVQMNPAAEKILGYHRNELIGREIDLLFPNDASLIEEYKKNVLEQVSQGKTITSYNMKRIGKKGNELSLTVTVAPVIDEDGIIKFRIHSITDMTEQNKLQHQIDKMENLKKYFPSQIVEKLVSEDGNVNLGYDRRKVTIFFSDLVGFTELSDSMEAEEITSILNEYFTSMSAIVYHYSCTLDKFIGDAIMVFFGAPTSNGAKQDAIHCVHMALDMQEKIIELNKSWKLVHPLQMRIGINSGFVTVGNFGSDVRLEYTIIGTPVNIASRLEHKCTPGRTLISFETAQYVKDQFKLQEMEVVELKGIHREIRAFEVFSRST